MTLYFYSSLFLTLIIFFVVVEKKKIKVKRDNIYVFLASVLTLIASFRWGVGGDWSSYLATYELDNYTLQNLRWSFFFKFFESTIFIFWYRNIWRKLICSINVLFCTLQNRNNLKV